MRGRIKKHPKETYADAKSTNKTESKLSSGLNLKPRSCESATLSADEKLYCYKIKS